MAIADPSVQTLQAFLDVFLLVSIFMAHTALVGGGLLALLLRSPTTRRAELSSTVSRHNTTLPTLTQVFFVLTLGLVVNMLALFALGMSGWFTPRAVLGVGLMLGVLGIASLVAFARRDSREGSQTQAKTEVLGNAVHGGMPKRRGTFVPEILTLLALYAACIFSSLHPPGMWDDTLYHLPLARLYVEEERIVLSEAIRYSLFPQNMNLLMSLGLMAGGGLNEGGVLVAQAVCTIPLFVMAVGLAGFSRQMTHSSVPGLLAALLLFVLPPLASTVGYAYVDIGLALFCWAAAYAFLLAGQDGSTTGANTAGANTASGNTASSNTDSDHTDRGTIHSGTVDSGASGSHNIGRDNTETWILLAGVFAGAAMGVKMTAVIMAGLLGLFLIWHLRAQPRPVVVRRVLLYGLGLVVAGAGWYVRSAWISGDPIHPAGAPFFGYFLWNEVDYAWQKSQVMTATTINPLNLLQVLAENGIVVWLASLVGLVSWRHLLAALRSLYAIFILYFAFWFFVTQVDRYLAPVAAIGMFLSVYAVWKMVGSERRLVQGVAAAAILAGSAVLMNVEAMKAESRMQNWEPILHAQKGNRLIRQANAHIPEYGPRLLQIGFESQAWFFEGTMIGDWFGPGRYWDLMHCTETCGTMFDSATMAERMHKHGARMLVFGRHMDRNFDPAMYADRFDVLYEDEEGVLMVLREGGE